jgi:uncharacterized protein YneF (UPF0154 family)
MTLAYMPLAILISLLIGMTINQEEFKKEFEEEPFITLFVYVMLILFIMSPIFISNLIQSIY